MGFPGGIGGSRRGGPRASGGGGSSPRGWGRPGRGRGARWRRCSRRGSPIGPWGERWRRRSGDRPAEGESGRFVITHCWTLASGSGITRAATRVAGKQGERLKWTRISRLLKSRIGPGPAFWVNRFVARARRRVISPAFSLASVIQNRLGWLSNRYFHKL